MDNATDTKRGTVASADGSPSEAQLSEILYSRDGQRAVVAISYSDCGRCSHGDNYLLLREAGSWRVLRRTPGYVC